ncbi:MAG TPA: hypothetical protein VNO30_37710 [Kofleriaceae bacterium]|nr:hypothetical protein [Kofleriaceae bacterium]
MDHGESAQAAFVWTRPGTINNVGIELMFTRVAWIDEVIEFCHRMRFAGTIELIDCFGETRAFQWWLRGEPQQVNDPSIIILAGRAWFMGNSDAGACAGIRVTQRIPTFQGKLADSATLCGELAEDTLTRVVALCAEHLLSADLVLQGSRGDVATLGFTEGHADTTVIAEEVLDRRACRYELRLRPMLPP